MTLQTLSKEILAQAKKQSDECKKATQERIDALAKEREQELDAYEKKQLEAFNKEQELLEKEILGKYHLQAKELIRKAQRTTYEEVLQGAVKQLQEDTGEKKTKLLQKLFTLAQEEISVAYIYAPKDCVAQFKKIGAKNILVEARQEENTILFLTKDKEQSVTFTFEELVRHAIEQQEKEMYAELF